MEKRVGEVVNQLEEGLPVTDSNFKAAVLEASRLGLEEPLSRLLLHERSEVLGMEVVVGSLQRALAHSAGGHNFQILCDYIFTRDWSEDDWRKLCSVVVFAIQKKDFESSRYLLEKLTSASKNCGTVLPVVISAGFLDFSKKMLSDLESVSEDVFTATVDHVVGLEGDESEWEAFFMNVLLKTTLQPNTWEAAIRKLEKGNKTRFANHVRRESPNQPPAHQPPPTGGSDKRKYLTLTRRRLEKLVRSQTEPPALPV